MGHQRPTAYFRLRGRQATWAPQIAQEPESQIQDLLRVVDGMADRAAVAAALSLPWSTGPVDGYVHRVKLLKRRGHGRAKLDVLRRLVLAREDRCLSSAITAAGRPGRERIPA